MKKLIALLLLLIPLAGRAQTRTDTYPTSVGDVTITPIGHGSLMIGFGGKTIHVDPYGGVGDYGEYPKADLILITHEHRDHFDKRALELISKPESYVIATPTVARLYDGVDEAMGNGESTRWNGVGILAVPAYNIVNVDDQGQPRHPKGVGNGYVLTFGDFRVYIAGDTEPIPEMEDLAGIHVAFLPKNLPYTMSDEQFVEAARIVAPKVLYPYHYSGIDRQWLSEKLPGIKLIFFPEKE